MLYLTVPLHKALIERPDATATVCGSRRQTYTQLVGRIARLAGALQTLGIAAGDRIGMLALNSDRYVEYAFGTWWAGAVINPVNIRWSAREVAYSLDDCDTRILLVDDQFAALAEEIRDKGLSQSLQTLIYAGDQKSAPAGMLHLEQLIAEASPVTDAQRHDDDLCAIMYTGGTTGTPKGVMLTHSNIVTNVLGTLSAAPREPMGVSIQAAPLFHIGGLSLMIQMMFCLGSQIILPGFDDKAVLKLMDAERVTETFMVPIMLKRLLESADFNTYDLSSLRTIIYGASPMDAALLARAMAALPNVGFMQSYGMTECAPVITMLPPQFHCTTGPNAAKLRSAGRPITTTEVRIVDENDRDVPRGQVGEVLARSPSVMAGYWGKSEQTASTLRNGWLHTGDGGYMDSDGFIYIVDRMKDMIVTGGENVYSAEVENALLQLSGISMCAVIGVPDENWGERVHAVIVLHTDVVLDEKTIIDHCRGLIAGYKCPRSIEFRAALPMSAAGKLLKFELRDPFWQGHERRI